MKPRVLIIIPAFNEEASLPRTVSHLREHAPQYDFLIVNDGSVDGTEAICRANGYPYISFLTNLGLTGAFCAGMKYAYRNNYDYAIQFDADGQHDARYISDLVDTAIETGANIVIGSRFVDRPKPVSLRMFGSALLSILIKITTGQKLNDPTSGMRLYDARTIALFATGFDYSPEPDTVGFLMRRGFKVREVQVEMHERFAGHSYLTLSKSAKYMQRMHLSLMYIQWFRRLR